MYKNQLQELAQRSCFNLPSYSCIREGPDHAPRFKAAVNFNGDTFESPNYCSTLRQAEHSAAEVALNALANGGPSQSLAAKILDETGVYKNLLQEVSQRVGASLPTYTTYRSGLGHLPVFTCRVELAGVTFTGEPAKNKKQAEKNAAMAAWSSLKSLEQQSENSMPDKGRIEEQEHVSVARALQIYLIKAKVAGVSFPINFQTPPSKPSSIQQAPATSSKILPLICPRTRSHGHSRAMESPRTGPARSLAAGAAPYIPVRHFSPHNRIAPPVTIRNAIPVFSAPPHPPPSQSPRSVRPPSLCVAPPVSVRQVVPVYASPLPVRTQKLPSIKESPSSKAPLVQVKEAPENQVKQVAPAESITVSRVQEDEQQPVTSPVSSISTDLMAPEELTRSAADDKLQESLRIRDMKTLHI